MILHLHFYCLLKRSLNNLLVRVLDSWSKGCESKSQQEWWENFLLQSQLCGLTLNGSPFHPCVTAVACKRPWSFCQKCRWQVAPKHAYTHDPSKLEWADYAAVQAECGTPSGNKLTSNLSGNTRSRSSQLAKPLWTDPGLKSGVSLHDLISTLKFKKSTDGEWFVKHSPKILTWGEKATTRTTPPLSGIRFRCIL